VNEEDIIRMAREAGISNYGLTGWTCWPGQLERFAVLVAAAEREAIKWNSIHSCHADCQNPACVIVREAVAAEREACAKLCDEAGVWIDGEWTVDCAAAIRARGQGE
jgi:hypothetical protein